ncbi:hypothetical protein J5N97_014731 [Dioscorea zingiberensis]|uniref:RNA polymerase II nuclear localization protein SLC7A6OS n=1 Tax=Dioscorea zingiberensis TaxID=325984 RepID=A0A9D5CV78_9LILI|nr:hypothetical protein J5N97_014731 [Dioscorea zingiberensis]
MGERSSGGRFPARRGQAIKAADGITSTDGAKPPEIPEEFRKLVKGLIQASHDFLLHQNKDINVEDELPKMSPDICIVNFYNENGRLGLHQKQDRLLLEAREKHEDLARSARFTQIWKSRMDGIEMDDNSLQEICHLYDVVRVDEQEKPGKLSEPLNVSIEDNAILHSYLPLLREFLPTAAEEIESDLSSFQDKIISDYNNLHYCLFKVQVDEEDEYYEGPPQCEYETDDSNVEDNPLNEYPDEESSQDEEKEKDPLDFLSDADSQYANIDSDEEDEDWKWGCR